MRLTISPQKSTLFLLLFFGLFTLSISGCGGDKESSSLKPNSENDDYKIDDYTDSKTDPEEDLFKDEEFKKLFEDDDISLDDEDGNNAKETSTSSPKSDEILYDDDKDNSSTSSRAINRSPVNESIGDDGMQYLVIVNTFSVKENADKLVEKLQTSGFSNAEVVQFKAKEFFTVIAGRYASNEAATQASAQVDDAGNFNSYVHKKRYKN